eukprot:124168-Amorphochlora_amoeboformis.AAC.2
MIFKRRVDMNITLELAEHEQGSHRINHVENSFGLGLVFAPCRKTPKNHEGLRRGLSQARGLENGRGDWEAGTTACDPGESGKAIHRMVDVSFVTSGMSRCVTRMSSCVTQRLHRARIALVVNWWSGVEMSRELPDPLRGHSGRRPGQGWNPQARSGISTHISHSEYCLLYSCFSHIDVFSIDNPRFIASEFADLSDASIVVGVVVIRLRVKRGSRNVFVHAYVVFSGFGKEFGFPFALSQPCPQEDV